MDKNILGNKIKQLRKVKGLSQEKLGEKSDLTQQHISRIENGTVLPSISTLSKISKVFNIPIDDLADIDIRDREDKYTLAIIKKLDFLGIEDKCKVEGYIDRILDENGVDKLIIK